VQTILFGGHPVEITLAALPSFVTTRRTSLPLSACVSGLAVTIVTAVAVILTGAFASYK
jgi:hypothetical protein